MDCWRYWPERARVSHLPRGPAGDMADSRRAYAIKEQYQSLFPVIPLRPTIGCDGRCFSAPVAVALLKHMARET